MKEPETLAQYWLANVQKFKGTDKVAVRQKDLGIWQRFTWDEEYRQVRQFALGLVALGLQRGDRVAIIGDNDREYLWASLAIMAAGGTVVGIFTDVTPAEVEYIVNHSDAKFVIAGDQEQCDKLLEIKGQIPAVKQVIYWDDRGMWYYKDEWLKSFKDVQALGGAWREERGERSVERGAWSVEEEGSEEGGELSIVNGQLSIVNEEGGGVDFEGMIAVGRADEVAMICYTSGTTGLPKGAMLSHGNFTYAVKAFSAIDPRYPTDNYLSFIPLAWVGGAALDIAPHTVDGVVLNFAERPETVQQNIREIAPDALLYNSRLWENLVASIRARMLDSNWLNRGLYRLFLQVGYRVADYRFEKKGVPAHWALLYRLGNWLLFRPLLSQFGLHRARVAYTAGAALSPDVMRFFQAMGLALRQIYGSTEVAGGAVAHRAGDVKFETLGVALPGAQVKLSPEGEILINSPGLFLGYHKNPEATEATLWCDEKGERWLRTGDAGTIDADGHLIYLDRVKDMIELAGGEKYSPQYIEGRLKFSPFISHALTIGDKSQNYVTAMITMDFENVGRWAEKHGLPYTTYADLSQKPEVYELIRKDVEEVNRTLPAAARVRKFVLLHKEFDADEGEMTRTRKLRRGFLAERYADIIHSLYGSEREVAVSATVKYRDGREGRMDTVLRIEALATE